MLVEVALLPMVRLAVGHAALKGAGAHGPGGLCW